MSILKVPTQTENNEKINEEREKRQVFDDIYLGIKDEILEWTTERTYNDTESAQNTGRN